MLKLDLASENGEGGGRSVSAGALWRLDTNQNGRGFMLATIRVIAGFDPAFVRRAGRLLDEHFSDAEFEPQVVIDRFIADFYSERLRLVIELDGKGHKTPMAMEHDKARDAMLNYQGITVLRFDSGEVFRCPEAIINRIRRWSDSKVGIN